MKRIISTMLVIVALFAFTSVAFAASDSASWSSSVCRNSFVTSDYLSKTSSTYWTTINVTFNSVVHTPDNPNASYNTAIQIAPRNASGQNIVPVGTYDPNMYHARFSDMEWSDNRIYLYIANPNSGTSNPTNMASNGSFIGFHS